MQRLPKYFGLYLGKDGLHTPYHGIFAHVYLWAGEGSKKREGLLIILTLSIWCYGI